MDRLERIKHEDSCGLGVSRSDFDWLVEQAELAKELGDLLPQKQLVIDRLRGLLAQLEWNRDGRCNGCEGFQWTGGHDPDCWLAAELAGQRHN